MSNMYNHVVKQVIVNKQIVISDPQKYINSNLGSVVILTDKAHNKYKHLLRFNR